MKETENPLDLISSCDDGHEARSSGSRVLTIAIVLILLVLIITGVIIAIMITNKVKKTADSISEVKEAVIDEFGEETTSENFEQDLGRAMDTIDASTSAVFAQQFVTYDYTKVSGDGVINAIKLFEGSPVAIVVQTEKAGSPELALNYGALITSDCKESNGSNNSPLFDESNQCYIVNVDGANTDNIGIQKNDNGRDYLANLHRAGDSVSYYYPDYDRLNDKNDIQYIDNTSSFKSNLIRNDSGSIIGIYFKELENSSNDSVVIELLEETPTESTEETSIETSEETPIIKDDIVVEEPAELEEKLDSVIFISDRKEYKSDLTEDELSKYDDKNITAQDVLDLASIAADKNTVVFVQTKAIRSLSIYEAEKAAINFGAVLPDGIHYLSLLKIMTNNQELCNVYDGQEIKCTLDLDKPVDDHLITNNDESVILKYADDGVNPDCSFDIYKQDNFFIANKANRFEYYTIVNTRDTTVLTDKENAAYIDSSHKFHAYLIKDYKGTVIGVYIKEK